MFTYCNYCVGRAMYFFPVVSYRRKNLYEIRRYYFYLSIHLIGIFGVFRMFSSNFSMFSRFQLCCMDIIFWDEFCKNSLLLANFIFKPSRPNPGRRLKINLKLLFALFFVVDPQRSVKIKTWFLCYFKV